VQRNRLFLRWMSVPLFYLLFLIDLIYVFTVQWWRTRRWFSLLRGLPAILCALAFLAIGPWYAGTSTGEWAGTYERAGNAALERGDWQSAMVYFRRSVLLSGDSMTAGYGLALTVERQGDVANARNLMLRIAPESQPGYPPAHLWLARTLMRQKTPLGPRDLDVLEHHLQQALRYAPQAAESRAGLARLYELRGKTDRAIEQLVHVVAQRPALNLTLARLYVQAGDSANAHRAAFRAGEHFQVRALAESGRSEDRLFWAASLVLQERYEDAEEVLNVGLAGPDPQPFRNALVTLYLRWLGTVTASDEPDASLQLQLLERVLEHDPSNQKAMVILCNLAIRQEASTDQAAELLNQLLQRDAAPPFILIGLGISALHHGESELALRYFRQNLQHNPQLPILLNNLAWALAHQNEAQLELAVQLGEAALQLAEHPEFRDTLGTILAKLGRAEQAVEQLEIALRGLPPRAEIYERLGDLYQQLGRADLAAEHHRQAAKLEAAKTPGKPE
jgi:tetratricopeptide (TPR) repeat protein